MDEQTILVVEDNAALGRYIANSLKKSGFRPVLADSGKAAFAKLKTEVLDLVLLDLKLGDIDGIEVLRTIRRQTESLPVIIVSTCTELEVKVGGFEIGCDDYITKPFYSDELISRIRRQLKLRSGIRQELGHPVVEEITCGPFRLDIRSATLYKNGSSIDARNKLFDIMLFFAQNAGQVISKQRILSNCWENFEEVSDNTLYVHIRRLRTLVEDDPARPEYIRTVRGVGFMFQPEAPVG